MHPVEAQVLPALAVRLLAPRLLLAQQQVVRVIGRLLHAGRQRHFCIRERVEVCWPRAKRRRQAAQQRAAQQNCARSGSGARRAPSSGSVSRIHSSSTTSIRKGSISCDDATVRAMARAGPAPRQLARVRGRSALRPHSARLGLAPPSLRARPRPAAWLTRAPGHALVVGWRPVDAGSAEMEARSPFVNRAKLGICSSSIDFTSTK